MLAQLSVEAIGNDTDMDLRMWRGITNDLIPGLGDMTFGKMPASYWCAKILGPDPRWKWKREFVKGNKDYSRANSKGSRGVYVTYVLESGSIYEVKEPVSWKNCDRYFCRVTQDGEIERLSEDEVRECFRRK